MKIKQTFLALGAATFSAAPLITTVSCFDSRVNKHGLLPTYTGQADQLLALGIVPDYYPLQLSADQPYDYLRAGLKKHMYDPSSSFAIAFENKLLDMFSGVSKMGPSWWNQFALESGEEGSDPAYWQRQSGDVLLYEHFLLDDDAKIIDSSMAPKHKIETALKTNFRSSRDPYTRLSIGTIAGHDLDDSELNSPGSSQVTILPGHVKERVVTVTEKDKAIIKSLRDESVINNSSQLFNNGLFADEWYHNYMASEQFANSHFPTWLEDKSLATNADWIFDQTLSNESMLSSLFAASTYTDEEKDIGMGLPDYFSSLSSRHHPIYEQQEGEIGAAPMFEGAIRDNMLYLYNIASQIDNLVTTGNHKWTVSDYNAAEPKDKADADSVKSFVNESLTSAQIGAMITALERANDISRAMEQRLLNMKNYFSALGASNKVFGVLTIAPGHGMSTIQSVSKYSFLYKELGFKQPLPTNLAAISADPEGHAQSDGALFNMDDNGWWWNLGTNASDIATRASLFDQELDMGVITARDVNFKATIEDQSTVTNALVGAFKKATNLTDLKNIQVDYDLWNEGIKTPFIYNMVLDQILKVVETWFISEGGELDPFVPEQTLALEWGSYWSEDFLTF